MPCGVHIILRSHRRCLPGERQVTSAFCRLRLTLTENAKVEGQMNDAEQIEMPMANVVEPQAWQALFLPP